VPPLQGLHGIAHGDFAFAGNLRNPKFDGSILVDTMGIVVGNYFTDTAFTVGIGRIASGLQKLIDVTRESLNKGIAQAVVDNHLSDVSHAIQNYIERHNLSVVRDFVGHGIGRKMHEEPKVPNFVSDELLEDDIVLTKGMVIAVEPMINAGTAKVRTLQDGWTVVTKDGKCSAHFEHTIAITEDGCEVLTVK